MNYADDLESIAGSAPASTPSGGRDYASELASITPQESTAASKAALPRNAMKDALGKTIDRAAAVPQVIANQATSLGHSIMGGWRGLAAIATGAGLDEAARQVESPDLPGGTTAATYEPPKGSAGATAVAATQSPVNPLNWPAMLAHKGGDVTMDVTGSPGAATAVETGLNAIPLMLGRKAATRAEPKLVGSSSIADAKPVEVPLSQVGQAENLDVPTIIRRGGKAAVETPGRAPLSLVPREGEAMPAATQAPKPVLSIVPNEPPRPPAPGETPPQAAAAQAEAAAPKFAESAPAAAEALPLPDQLARRQVLQRIGLDDVRSSAVTGDGKAASTDFQLSKLDNSAGDYMRTVLSGERAALTDHAENIVRDTGGTLGTDAQTLEARGHTILAPLDGLKDWFDTKTKALYQAADARAGGVPAQMPKTQALINGDQAEFLGTTEGEALLRGVKARMKSLGMVDENGAPQAATVQQAEQLKQYLNNVWQPRTARLIRSMKDSIDEDVTSSAGEDIYKTARGMRAMRAATLDDPNGIAKIMDASGPEEVNRSVPVERVADTIAAMPNAQFAHIVQTLKNVPPELQPQAQAALAEIKAQFANRIRDAGASRVAQWGARDVSIYLNKNSAKLAQVFEPDELAKIADLNDAGHILAQDRSYPGAAVQTNNLMQRGVLTAIPKVAAGVGGVLGALVGAPGTGALIGDTAGAAAASRLGEKAALRSTQKRVIKLSDVAK